MTYKTCAGDTFDLISYKIFGTEKYLVELMKANLNHIETIIFPAGEELKIPDITPEIKAVRLPAWRR